MLKRIIVGLSLGFISGVIFITPSHALAAGDVGFDSNINIAIYEKQTDGRVLQPTAMTYDSFGKLFQTDKTITACEVPRLNISLHKTDIASFSLDSFARLKLFVDEELRVDRKLRIRYPNGPIDDSYTSVSYDFTLPGKLLTAGEHTIRGEAEVLDESESNLKNNAFELKVNIAKCEASNSITPNSGELLWGGVVYGSAKSVGEISLGSPAEAVVNAMIDVDNGKYATTSNADGRWWLVLPQGVHTIKVSKVGYSIREFEVSGNQPYYLFANLENYKTGAWFIDPTRLTQFEGNFDINDLYENVTEDQWYTVYLKDLVKDGFYLGNSTTGMKPNVKIVLDSSAKLDRGTVMSMLLRFLGENWNDMVWDPKNWNLNLNDQFCDEKVEDMNGGTLEMGTYMKSKGWLTGEPAAGCAMTNLNASKPISRIEALSFIYRVLGVELPQIENINVSMFSDVKKEDWFAGVVQKSYEDGIIVGYQDGTFRPADTINLAEFAKMYVNLKNLYIKS